MKLVRDKVPALYATGELQNQRPGRYTFRRATPTERLLLLRLKLAEEVGEVLSAPAGGAFLEELADLVDVVEAACEAHGWTVADLVVARARKQGRLGGFDEGWVLEIADAPAPEGVA